MANFEPLAVVVATSAAFLLSGAWYALLPAQSSPSATGEAPAAKASSSPVLAGEILRSAVVATVIAGLAATLDAASIGEGALLGLVLWVGFPAVLFAGSIIHERYPVRLAAVHLGDWLLKLVLIGVIVGALQ